jgi:hypothetical protein
MAEYGVTAPMADFFLRGELRVNSFYPSHLLSTKILVLLDKVEESQTPQTCLCITLTLRFESLPASKKVWFLFKWKTVDAVLFSHME